MGNQARRSAWDREGHTGKLVQQVSLEDLQFGGRDDSAKLAIAISCSQRRCKAIGSKAVDNLRTKLMLAHEVCAYRSVHVSSVHVAKCTGTHVYLTNTVVSSHNGGGSLYNLLAILLIEALPLDLKV